MGLDGGATRPDRAARPAGQRPTAARPAAAEAIAEITLDEAYHGTTRLIEVDGKRLEVTIPKGADTGTRIRLSGKAPGGGDIHVVVRQRPDPTFTRRGADLERELPVTLGEALLGAEVPVRTPKGRVLLTIPAGTQPGRTVPADAARACPASRRPAMATSRQGPRRPADRPVRRGARPPPSRSSTSPTNPTPAPERS